MQEFKHNPEVRAYFCEKQRRYRAKKKAKEAEACKQPASLTPTTTREVAINEDKGGNK